MLNVRSKLECQQARNYAKGVALFREEEMQFYAYWYKFEPEIRPNIENFNIFSAGALKKRPGCYNAQLLAFKKFQFCF